jgi:hypothetical protein
VKKKALLTIAFLSVLLLSAVAGTQFADLGQANPYRYIDKWGPPPADAIPLIISLSSPEKKATYNVNDVTVAFTVTTQGTSVSTSNIHFAASWLQDNVTIPTQGLHNSASYNETFHDMPNGNYSIVIIAIGSGSYVDPTRIDYFDGTRYHFEMTTMSIINFTIATPLEVSVLSPKNETYGSSEVPLNLAVDKSFVKISYALDYQDNITINGNATLTGLTNGAHNLRVYALDTAGNVGSSETVTFNVDAPEPLPTIFVPAVSIALVATVGAGLLLYYKKRR